MTPRTIVLVGLPGSGKSRIGRMLAAALGVSHVDTDDLIVESAGKPISDIFIDEGEAGFRKREEQAVAEAIDAGGVVSLGGGAVETPTVRELLAPVTVVHLDVDHDELLRRTSRKTHRPLLREDPDGALRDLRERREAFYADVETLRVHGDDGPPERLVAEILHALEQSEHVHVGGDEPYDVVIGHDVARAVVGVDLSDATRALVIHTASVAQHVSAVRGALETMGLVVDELEVADAEAGKTLDQVARAWDVCGELRLGRRDVIVGVGGGAVTDMAGFVAATWLRGVRVIQVPTTVLGMVDAAVGGKTGINTDVGKNLVGSFHVPSMVIEDLDTLRTLPDDIVREGLGEVVKCGFIRDDAILRLTAADPAAAVDVSSETFEELVRRSVQVKADVVAADLQEGGLREILNYGHTLAHAIEKCENYTWRHGEAVAVGCVFAAELARVMGLLSDRDVQAHRDAFDLVNLPISYEGATFDELYDAMTSDKKVRGGQLRFVLLDGLQNPIVVAVKDDDLRAAAAKVGIHV